MATVVSFRETVSGINGTEATASLWRTLLCAEDGSVIEDLGQGNFRQSGVTAARLAAARHGVTIQASWLSSEYA